MYIDPRERNRKRCDREGGGDRMKGERKEKERDRSWGREKERDIERRKRKQERMTNIPGCNK